MNRYYNHWNDRQLRYIFDGSSQVNETFSQAWQDIFVLSVLNGQRGGTYLEIGCNMPDYTNNTYLLSKNFDWRGYSIDILSEIEPHWRYLRPMDNLIIADALTYNYNNLLQGKSTVDYLQVDIEPSYHSLIALQRLPHDTCRFKVITFETDVYTDGPAVQQESRKFLEDLGYQLIVGDVIAEGYGAYEDWWVDPSAVDMAVANNIKSHAVYTQHPADLLLQIPNV